jgi:hypothetical protein
MHSTTNINSKSKDDNVYVEVPTPLTIDASKASF